MSARVALAAALAAGSAIAVLGGAATAQTAFAPPRPSTFGAPSITRVPDAPADRPDLLGPTDLPDAAPRAGARAPAGADPSRVDPSRVDLAFGAYQRGFYATAMREAMKRLAAAPRDGAAMTLAGELYAQGLGVRPFVVDHNGDNYVIHTKCESRM